MNTDQRRLVRVGAPALSLLVLNGCATMHADDGQLHILDAFTVYAPFDNSRGWGPSYLVGAPGHHFGIGARIDDARTDPPMLGGKIDGVETPAAPAGAGSALRVIPDSLRFIPDSLRVIPDDRPTDNVLDQTALIDPHSDQAFGLHSDGSQHITRERVPFELQCIDPP